MGQFDQAARSAADLEAGYLLGRVAAMAKLDVRYRRWFDPRTVPLPGGPERTADLVAIMDDPRKPEAPWLFVLELQTRHEERKQEVLLVETAIFACYAKDTDREGGSFLPLPVFIYLSGLCPRPEIDFRSPAGFGLLCAPVIWEMEKDSALNELGKVDAKQASWDALFWTVLMDGGGSEKALKEWRRLLDEKVPANRRADVAFLALELAELTGSLPALEGVLGDLNMTESTVHNRAVELGASRERIRIKRADLIAVLNSKFSEQIPEDYLNIIRQQESFALLETWFQAALDVSTATNFLEVMRK